MRARLRNLSFRNKLLLAFLLIGVVPLLISTLLMLNIFRVTLAGNARDAAQAELDGAVRALDTLLGEGVETLHNLAGDGLVCAELSEPGSQPPQSVYDALYTLSSGLRGQADFALYSAQGELLFTTGTGSAAELGTHWGLLNAAAQADSCAFSGDGGYMLAAKALLDGDVPLGYAVMSLGAVQLDELFSAYAGSGGILLLDPYWDCVYRSANAGGEDLAPCSGSGCWRDKASPTAAEASFTCGKAPYPVSCCSTGSRNPWLTGSCACSTSSRR